MDAPSTSLEQHERGIHVGPYGGAGVTDPVLASACRRDRSNKPNGVVFQRHRDAAGTQNVRPARYLRTDIEDDWTFGRI